MYRLTRSKIMLIISLFLLLFVIVGCKKDQPTLTFVDTDLTYDKGEEFTLNPIITGIKGTDLVEYTFDVDGIVTYAKGKFTAVGKGEVNITAKLKGYPDVKVVIHVTITWVNEPVKVTSIAITGNANMKVGDKQTLTATVESANATDKKVNWSTSNADIATVNSNGEVSALKVGTVTITAIANDGSGINKTFSITIAEVITGSIIVSGPKEGYVGDSIILTTILETNATDKTLIWSVDSNKATVTDGVVTLVSSGTVVVTVKLAADEDIIARHNINIYDKVSKITLVSKKNFL